MRAATAPPFRAPICARFIAYLSQPEVLTEAEKDRLEGWLAELQRAKATPNDSSARTGQEG